MLFAIAFHAGDKDQAARLLSWIKELGGYDRHRFFVMPAKGQRADFTDAPPFEVVPDSMGVISDWSNPGAVRDASGPNTMIRQLAWRFYQSGLGPWMFLEPDCIPLVPEWADRIEDEYKRAGKLFMGARVPGQGSDYPDHSTGNMVVPQDVAGMSQNLMLPRYAVIDGKTLEMAFDVAAASDVLANHHDTPLLHHVFRGPEFVTEADLQRIRPGAVLFHTAKGPGLVRLLREKRFGARHGVARDVQTETVSPTADEISETPRTKVFTYFAPVQSVEGLAEQNRLIELWRNSWRKHGWEPVVLTEDDAAKHPDYETLKPLFEALPTINPKGYEMASFLRWIAMAVAGPGVLSDYDCLNRSFKPEDVPIWAYGDEAATATPLAKGVPCVVAGGANAFKRSLSRLAGSHVVSTEKGQPHVSDMHIIQGENWHCEDICREYGTPGWQGAKLVHFGHYSCAPNKRSEVIADALESPLLSAPSIPTEKVERFHAEMLHVQNLARQEAEHAIATNGSKPESIVGLIRDGVGILSQLATNHGRKASILNELRKAGLVGQAKKRARRKLAMA